MAIWNLPGRLWTIARKVEAVFVLQAETRAALEAIEVRLHALEHRMTHLEANQGQIVTEAKAAAGVAATGLASSVISEVVTRLTRVEMRHDDLRRRLVLPGSGAE